MAVFEQYFELRDRFRVSFCEIIRLLWGSWRSPSVLLEVFWGFLIGAIVRFGVQFLMGDFNMSFFFEVVKRLRSSGI